MAPNVHSIPAWAKLVPPRFSCPARTPLSLSEEEQYLRTRSYHDLSRQIDGAVTDTFELLGNESFHRELDILISKVAKSVPSQPINTTATITTTTTKAQDSSSAKPFVMEPQCFIDELLLPILQLECTPHGLDRYEWIRSLIRSSRHTMPRRCCIHIDAAQTSICDVTWQEELTMQCIRQEDNLPRALRKKSFRAKASISDTLLEWARNTMNFDDVLVFLHVEDDTLYTDKVQDFVHWLAHRRATHGIPFILVMLYPHAGRHPVIWRSSIQGPCGIMIRNCVLPCTKIFLDRLFENLWLRRRFPFPVPTNQSWSRQYWEQTLSAMDTVVRLRIWLAHRLCEPYSFLRHWHGLTCERNRLKWFVTNVDARRQMPETLQKRSWKVWIEEMERIRCLGSLSTLVHKFLAEQMGFTAPTLYLPPQKFESTDTAWNDSSTKAVIQKLIELQSLFKTSFREMLPRETVMNSVDTINRCIILLDKDHLQLARCVARYRLDWNRNGVDSTYAFAFAEHALNIQPRSQAIRGLFDHHGTPNNLVHLTGNIFSLMKDYTSISQSEWLALLRQTFVLEDILTDSLLVFGYAVYQLKLCGLVREKRTKNDVRFDKTVFVWCSDES